MNDTRTLANSTVNAPSRQGALAPDYDGHNMVFIVGCPRSGTTWLQRLLATHPRIRTGQESHVFAVNIGPQLRAWNKMPDSTHRGVGMACYFTRAEFLKILKWYLLELIDPMVGSLSPGELFLEKTPGHALFLPQISELLPKARVIHVLRDARDAVSSLLASDEWLSSWAPGNAAEAASVWTRHVRAARGVGSKLPAGQFLEVRYEDLSRSTASVLRQCADFLGLAWDDSDIARAIEANRPEKARATGGGTPIPLKGEIGRRAGPVVVEPKTFIRKARPGSWRSDLSLYQQFRVWHSAHLEMSAAGYDWPAGRRFAFSCLSSLVKVIKPKSHMAGAGRR